MAKHAGVWARLRRSVFADPGRASGGSAAGGPLEVLAVEEESETGLDRSAHDGEAAVQAGRSYDHG
jgi:hypothetical protein